MKHELIKGQCVSIVTSYGAELICNALTMGTTPFSFVSNRENAPIQRFDVYEIGQDQVVYTADAPIVLDADGNAYYTLEQPFDKTNNILN
jgi:hypothetical protein